MLSLKSSSLNLLLEDLDSKAAYVLPSTIAVRKSLLKVALLYITWITCSYWFALGSARTRT